MIEFIIKEKDNKIRRFIEQYMMNYDDEYKIESESSSKNYKIYILEYQSKTKEMLKEIKELRKKDWQSRIILLTDTETGIKELINLRIMPVDIILLEKGYEKELKEAINHSIRNIKERKDTLQFEYKNSIYNIPLEEILYIEKTKEEKKCKIHTASKDYTFLGTLSKIQGRTSSNFIKCSRSNLINIEQVLCYNKKENIITFRNTETFQNISRNYKKVVLESLRRVE